MSKYDQSQFDLVSGEILRGPANAPEDVQRVHVWPGHKPPKNAFVAVRLHGYWYYIDSCDQASKATFLLILELSRLNFARSSPNAAPVLTLPAGR